LATRLGFERRIYYSDIMVLRDVAAYGQFGAPYAKDVSRRLHLSIRQVDLHLSKLESLGWIERLGSRHCPFQAYRISRRFEVATSRILEHFLKLWKRLPGRFYFPVWYATPPSSYLQASFSRLTGGVCMPGRPGGRSVPFGVHLPVLRRGGVRELVLWAPFVRVGEDLVSEVWEPFDECDLFFSVWSDVDECERVSRVLESSELGDSDQIFKDDWGLVDLYGVV
jgi:hypothetical protein